MSLQGDLSTLDFAGLFQNIEAALKSGLLTVQVPGQGETRLYFHHGKLALIAYPGRLDLEDVLVAAGSITHKDLESARKRRKTSKRPLVELLVEGKAAQKAQIASVGAARLTSEACELINSGVGAFVFTEGQIPRGVFDPEERALGITLPAGPLLLESARRSDHWRMIRERVPSDSTHYVLARTPRAPNDPTQKQILEKITPLLDGSRSVSEIVAGFPHRRFEVYQVLSDLAETQAIRLAAPTEMNKMIQELSRHDRERALALLERGLQANPRNLNLLCTKALLAEELGDLEQASEALKVAVHLQLEAGAKDDARKGLVRLKELGPEDPFVWERSLELAIQEGRAEDALEDAQQLVPLYTGPGLFKKAAAVLERMVELSGGNWEHVKALAHARADGGDRVEAVKGLEEYGAARLAEENYAFAHKVFAEIVSIDPECESAKETIAEIKSGEMARKKAMWRKMKSRMALGGCAVLALFGLSYEILARRSYVQAQRAIAQRGLIESGRYAQALEVYAQMRAEFPWATVSLYDVSRQMSELEAKIAASTRLRVGP